jgi:UDP-4-amino-4,6-dideoxy-N-acetyl-beta-L-altrosamine transaminase
MARFRSAQGGDRLSCKSRRFLGYGRQSIDQSDVDAVVGVLRSDFLTQGPAVDKFEAALAERVGARHAVAVSSGTAALHIACLVAGLRPGDRGLTAAVTFAASANCLLYAGADAGFVDIDGNGLAMSPTALAHALEKEPGVNAIVSVHLAGLAHEAAAIRSLARKRFVIEDACHAIGGRYDCGAPIGCGAYSDMCVFSFHPVKTITTGEGGAVVTNDGDLARRLRMLRNHGIEREASRFVGGDEREGGEVKPWLYEQQVLGFNYRMTDIQAALGLSQLTRLEQFLERRRAIARRYDEAFARLPHLHLPQSLPEQRGRSGHHLYIVLIDFAALRTTRTAFMGKLREHGIGTQVHYIPVYRQPYYVKRYALDRGAFPESESYYARCLSLPFYPGLTDEDVEHVIATITRLVTAG